MLARRRRIPAASCAALAMTALIFGLLFVSPAFAADSDYEQELSELQQRIESTSADYEAAVAKANDIEAKIEETEAKIADVEAQLPLQREKSAAAVKALYLMQQDRPGLLELILSANDFNEFITSIKYLDSFQEASINEAARLTEMEEELTRTKGELEAAKEEAEAQKAACASALADAQAARTEAQNKAAEVAQQEETQAAQAIEEARAEDPEVEEPAEVTTPGVSLADPRDEFVAQWTPRIDAYLAGSPMAGTGSVFAEAAWDYGVDPRWSPAIAYTESSKGAVCFKPYNAWGWGNSSWSDWDSAIRAHVSGLARGYGYTISVSSAQKYCPDNWQHWYSVTLAQMESI
jgi:hypothetical protein